VQGVGPQRQVIPPGYGPRVAEPMEWGWGWFSRGRSAARGRSSSLDRTMTLSV
jgi:hypothetical protein